METKIVSLPILGMQRNLPDSIAVPGSCHEIINLRNRDGAWRPVGSKYSDENMILDDLGDFAWIYQHPVLPDSYFVGEKLGYLHIIHGSTVETAFLHYRLVPGEQMVHVDHIGFVLRIVTEYQGDYQLYLARYDMDSATYEQLRPIVAPRASFAVDEHADNPMVSDSAGSLEGAAGMYQKKMNELNRAGYLEGHALFMLAYRMSDGSFMKHSQPYYCYVGGDNIVHPLGVESVDTNKRYMNIQAGKPKVKFSYYASELAALAAYGGLIQSLCVFMCRPVSNYSPGTYNETETAVLQSTAVKGLPDESNYYLVHEIPLSDLLAFAGTDVKVSDYYDIDVTGIENLATKELLPVDNFSNHQVFGKCSFLFNERLHMGNITTLLGACQNLFKWDNNGTASDDGVNIHTISLVARLNTLSGERVVKILPDTIPLYAHDGIDYLFMNEVISYPDDRAFKLELWHDNGLVYSWTLKPHPGLNLAYCSNLDVVTNKLRIDTFNSTDAGIVGAYPTITENLKDTNRVQVSEQNSMFSFPAKNSYRVGLLSDVVLGFGTIGEPLSQGQFGTFPLYVFHEDGISSLEHGSGEVLYASIQPIAKDVCNNPRTILSIGGGVLFSTSTGLKMISGREVVDISDPVEGGIPTYLHNVNEYVSMLSNIFLAKVYVNLSGVDFRTYLKSAILAYDHVNREIIVSNPTVSEDWTEKYSYVFNMDSKTWHKITDNFSAFINHYPGYLGIIGTSLYDISREDGTVFPHVMLQTRPICFEKSFSKITRGKLYGYFHAQAGSFVTLHVYGSTDGLRYFLIGGSQAPGHEFLDIKISRSHQSCKYFIFVLCGQITGSDISHLEIEFMPSFFNKLR